MTMFDDVEETRVRDRKRPDGDWNHQYVDVNQMRMHYVREGEGFPIFLLHGWPEFWWSWHRNIPTLEKQFDVIAPDLRGFGNSQALKAENESMSDVALHASDIIALADALGIDRFGIVAHDVGAYITQYIAREFPERMVGAFFFNGPHPGIGRRWVDADHINQIWYQSFNQLPWAAKLVGNNRDTCRLYFENMLKHWSNVPGAFDDQIEFWVDNFMSFDNIQSGFNWYSANHSARMALVRDGAPDLPKIKTPTHFYWGSHDPVILSEWADNLGDYFENPHIEIAEGAGHFVQMELPEESNKRISDFFFSLI